MARESWDNTLLNRFLPPSRAELTDIRSWATRRRLRAAIFDHLLAWSGSAEAAQLAWILKSRRIEGQHISQRRLAGAIMDTIKLSVKARQVHNFRGRDQRPKARQCTHEVTRKHLTRVLGHFRCRSYLIIAHIQWESTTRSSNKEDVYCGTSYNGLFQFLVPPGLKINICR